MFDNVQSMPELIAIVKLGCSKFIQELASHGACMKKVCIFGAG
jgi:hypothetical protein